MIKVIVFDFDGVIVDSNPIKKNTYYSIFNSFKGGKKIVQEVLFAYEPNTRYFIIEKVLEKLAEIESINVHEVGQYRDKIVKEYGSICEQGIIHCAEVKGALANIVKLSEEYRLYINSLTPQGTLSRIVEERKLSGYFKGISGSDNTKITNLRTIMSSENVSSSEVLVVGDGILDLECALACDTHFIGIDNQEGSLRGKKLGYFLKDCTFLCDTVKQIEREILHEGIL